jgi:hypothetical protein
MPATLKELADGLRAIVEELHHEADSGAPGGMVAVYGELAVRHLLADHEGHWSKCGPCHRALRRTTAKDD